MHGEALAQAQSLPLIRDAEIEGLLRLYTRPIFKAAGINPESVKVYIINDPASTPSWRAASASSSTPGC